MTSRVQISILTIIIVIFVPSCFTEIQGKDEIIKTISQLLQNKKQVFLQIADTFQNIKSHSTDWQLENFAKSGVRFYSLIPFEQYGISFTEYKKLYYKNVDTTTSPCFVADFIIPTNFKEQIKKIYVRTVRIIKDTSNATRIINFSLNSDKFPPITRTVILSYFPQTIPDSINERNDLPGWTHIIDRNWLLRSIEN